MALYNSRLAPLIPAAINTTSSTFLAFAPARRLVSSLFSQFNCNRQTSTRQFSHSAPTMSASPFLKTMEGRRSIYALNKKIPVPQSRVQEIVHHAILHVPSSFNSQSTRIILLVNDEHDKFWEIVKDAIKEVVPAEQWPTSENKLNGFKAGYGTILYFDDTTVVKTFQEKFALYADKFPGWAQESNAMHQYAIWTALEAEGLGANLQHYHPLIDRKVASTWNVPEAWTLRAQMVIGGVVAPAGEKTFKKVEGERFLVYGA